jgi:hypothetical protein
MGKTFQSGESLPKKYEKEMWKCKEGVSVSKTYFVWN